MTSDVVKGSERLPANLAGEAYSVFFGRIQDGVFTLDSAGCFTFVNDFIARSSGFEASAFLGKRYIDFVRTEDRDRVRSHFEAVLAGSSPPPYELAYHTARGEAMWVEVATAPLIERGQIIGLLGLSRNIHRRKTAELALRESEEKYRTLVECLPLGVAIVQDGQIVFANRALRSILGVSDADDASLRDPLGFLVPAHRGVLWDRLTRRLQGEANLPSEYALELLRTNGELIEAEVIVTCTTYEGRPAVQCVVIDLTERLKLEEQVRQTQKMDAIGTLAGGVAHDFNNLLTAILGSAGLLKLRYGDSAGVAELAGVIQKAADRAALLTGQLLNFARREQPKFERTDLHSIVADVLHVLTRIIDKQIAITFTPAAHNPVVLADGAQIQQIILNLAVNARDAMPEGGRLLVETHNLTVEGSELGELGGLAPGDYLTLSVADTGVGIPPTIQARIFEPFFSTKPTGAGTGMGLAVAYGIVKSHKGTIVVDSLEGAGSRFTVFLPSGTGPQVVEVPVAEEEIHGRGTILFVDDEDVVRETGKPMLASLGYEVVAVSSGAAAVDCLRDRRGRIDLVVLDFAMPEMNGEQCFLALRQVDPSIKVLLSSGHGPNAVITRLLEGGVVGFVQKPYSLSRLSAAVANALQSRPTGEP